MSEIRVYERDTLICVAIDQTNTCTAVYQLIKRPGCDAYVPNVLGHTVRLLLSLVLPNEQVQASAGFVGGVVVADTASCQGIHARRRPMCCCEKSGVTTLQC
ncbi:hypothetical protein [Brevibacterium marinum]|uniref:hypothetical protein n=1 Tax=Brevibacterium marinum TaxID=418643 RepID=UPI00315962CC